VAGARRAGRSGPGHIDVKIDNNQAEFPNMGGQLSNIAYIPYIAHIRQGSGSGGRRQRGINLNHLNNSEKFLPRRHHPCPEHRTAQLFIYALKRIHRRL